MTSRRALSERLGKWAFWLMFVGVHVTFFTMHITGLMGMPRRVWTYQPGLGWENLNLISTLGSYMIGAGVLVFLVDLARNFRFSTADSAGNVYGAGTLEWLETDIYSTRSIPVIRERYPLWDRPELKDEVDQGRYFLPNAPTGARETIVTSPLNAEPQYLMRMPGAGWWHFLAAVFTAVGFLLLTVQLYWPAVASGAAAIGCVMAWLWRTDEPPSIAEADVGAGIVLPTYVSGPKSHGWWAMVVLMVVMGMTFAMTAFSYVFLWSRNFDAWPAAGTRLPVAACGLCRRAPMAPASSCWP